MHKYSETTAMRRGERPYIHLLIVTSQPEIYPEIQYQLQGAGD
jgi:hypothetical protein